MAKHKLSKHQLQRISRQQEARRNTLQRDSHHTRPQASELENSQQGLVVVRFGAQLAVADKQGKLWLCACRRQIGHPVCGDHVVWHPHGEDQGIVTALLPRKNALERLDYNNRPKPLAANISQLLVVIAPEPESTLYLVDQYLLVAEQTGVPATLIVNKADLLSNPAERQEFSARFANYVTMGYGLFWTSTLLEPDPELVALLAGQTSILVGQSGVGKSSLTRWLIPNQDIQIGQLSDATGLGRHTTSTATCYPLPHGGFLIDSPGVRTFRPGELKAEELEQYFREFRPFAGKCRYRNCAHLQEPDCAITQAVADGDIRLSRYQHFQQMLGREYPDFPSTEV